MSTSSPIQQSQVRVNPSRRRPLIGQLLVNPVWVAAIYVVLITLAEIFTTYTDPRIGVVVHMGLLVTMVFHIAFSREAETGVDRLLIPLMVAPLIRILSMSLPLEGFERIYWYAIISLPIFVVVPQIRSLLGYSWHKIGFNIKPETIPFQLLMICTGFIFGVTEYSILRPEPFISALTVGDLLIPALILLVFTGIMEEVVFRALMQQSAAESLGKWGGLLFATLIFAVLHIGYRSLLDLLFVFTAGFIWGIGWMRTGSLWGISIAHGITNILLFLVAPFIAPNLFGLLPSPARPRGGVPVGEAASAQEGIGVLLTSPQGDNFIVIVMLAFLVMVVIVGFIYLFYLVWRERFARDEDVEGVSGNPILLGDSIVVASPRFTNARDLYTMPKFISPALEREDIIMERFIEQNTDIALQQADQMDDLPAYALPYQPTDADDDILPQTPVHFALLVQHPETETFYGAHIALYDDLMIGIGPSEPGIIRLDLSVFGAQELGVDAIHCVVHHSHDGPFISAMESTHGTFIADQRLAPSEPHRISDQMTVQLANGLIIVFLLPESNAGA